MNRGDNVPQKKKHPGGRPPKEFDKDEFEKLCALQCTQAEILDWFDTTDKTLRSWIRRTYNKSFTEISIIKFYTYLILRLKPSLCFVRFNATFFITFVYTVCLHKVKSKLLN